MGSDEFKMTKRGQLHLHDGRIPHACNPHLTFSPLFGTQLIVTKSENGVDLEHLSSSSGSASS